MLTFLAKNRKLSKIYLIMIDFDNYFKLLFNDNPAISITTITATLAILTFILTFILKPLLTFIRSYSIDIKVKSALKHKIIALGSEVKYLPPILEMTITNTGKIKRFIKNPHIKTSKKFNGENIFSIGDLRHYYPHPLEPGQQFKVEYDTPTLLSSLSGLSINIKELQSIRIEIQDTTQKKYLSNKVKLSDILTQMKVIEKMSV